MHIDKKNKRISSKRALVERIFSFVKETHSNHTKLTTVERNKVKMLFECITFNIRQLITLSKEKKDSKSKYVIEKERKTSTKEKEKEKFELFWEFFNYSTKKLTVYLKELFLKVKLSKYRKIKYLHKLQKIRTLIPSKKIKRSRKNKKEKSNLPINKKLDYCIIWHCKKRMEIHNLEFGFLAEKI
jgi:hypothetical protein